MVYCHKIPDTNKSSVVLKQAKCKISALRNVDSKFMRKYIECNSARPLFSAVLVLEVFFFHRDFQKVFVKAL